MIYQRGTTSHSGVLNIAKAIGTAVGEGGIHVRYNDVTFKVDKGDPFYQDYNSGEEMVAGGMVNINITIY